MTQPILSLHAHGKLLLSGEYAVLDGALALALPTIPGQSLQVFYQQDVPDILVWESQNHLGHTWFTGTFRLSDWSCTQASDSEAGRWLELLGRAVRLQFPNWLKNSTGLKAVARLEFPNEWGLGSSSTLVSLFAQWAKADPQALLNASFTGSGYDVACATADGPILYQRQASRAGYVHIPFAPVFREQLHFLYLGKKQNSREGITRYRQLALNGSNFIDRISDLSWRLATATDFDLFAELLRTHEQLVAEALQLTPVQQAFFPDFEGTIKSLGAWGGDFVLVASAKPTDDIYLYFREKGYSTILPYNKLIRPFKANSTTPEPPFNH